MDHAFTRIANKHLFDKDAAKYTGLVTKSESGKPLPSLMRIRLQKAEDFIAAVVRDPKANKMEVGVVQLQPRSRAYANKHRKIIAMSPEAQTRTYVHELGHHLEYSNPSWKKKIDAWRARRTAGEKLQTLNDMTGNTHYRSNEVGYKDEFMNPYIGKVYEHGSTEVLSMGIEELFADPVGFIQKDPDMFDFIVDLLRGY